MPSVWLGDVIAYSEALTEFTQKALNDSNQATSLLNSEVSMMKKAGLQSYMALHNLTASQGGTCTIIQTECYTFISEEPSNITHLKTHEKIRFLP